MSVRKDGQGQEDESEIGKEVRLRWDGECEEKVGENVDKIGGRGLCDNRCSEVRE